MDKPLAVVLTIFIGIISKSSSTMTNTDNDQVVDIGTHNELLPHKGKYAGMWRAQVVWYRKELFSEKF